jgi:hypothetical protein
VAAELTMIIQINATVCAAEDHGEDEQWKIADGDKHRRVQEGEEEQE